MIVCRSHEIIPGASPERLLWRQLPTLASFYLNND
jgi:hypothetical protein